LIVFVTAGDPNLDKTIDFILEAEQAGASLVEIGIPFSDPLAEGVVIQAANERALQNGATIDKIFEMVAKVREKTQIPLVFLTYINPIFRYGVEAFMRRCREVGMDGLIVPDLPFEEREELAPCCEAHGLDLIALIAPTSTERVQKIGAKATGFVYLVSSLGVTGMRSDFAGNLSTLAKQVKSVTDTPVAIGFGISTPEQAARMKDYADGLIVGSAVVDVIAQHGENADKPLYDFVKSLKDAMR